MATKEKRWQQIVNVVDVLCQLEMALDGERPDDPEGLYEDALRLIQTLLNEKPEGRQAIRDAADILSDHGFSGLSDRLLGRRGR